MSDRVDEVREGLDHAAAEEIAATLTGVSQDVRDAIRVARLVPQLGVQVAVELLGLSR